jgi:phage gpG-like protein
MDPSALPGYLEGFKARVPSAALPVAIEMARTYQSAVQRNLALLAHAPFTFTPSPPGAFPARMTGNLRRHIVFSGAGGASSIGWASISADTIYAAVQEYGHTMHAHSWRKPMSWYNEGQWWSKYEVKVPARPYMRPTTAQVIANGSLARGAMAMFTAIVWG